MGFNFFYLRHFWTLCIWICVGYICPLQCGLGLKLQGADLKIIIISIVANCGSQTIVAGGAWTHGPGFTRKVSWPLAQSGALFLVNPGVIEALHSGCYTTPPKSSRLEDLVKRGLWLEGQAGRAEVWLAGDMLNGAETCSSLALAWYAHHVGVTNVANHGSLAQSGALFLVNPVVIEALHSGRYSMYLSFLGNNKNRYTDINTNDIMTLGGLIYQLNPPTPFLSSTSHTM